MVEVLDFKMHRSENSKIILIVETSKFSQVEEKPKIIWSLMTPHKTSKGVATVCSNKNQVDWKFKLVHVQLSGQQNWDSF